jgi:hypothetical protein
MKQTAVEWLIIKLNLFNITKEEHYEILCQIELEAKEIEKQQIIDAREDGHLSTYAEYGETPKCYLDGGHEQYYNETFKNEK